MQRQYMPVTSGVVTLSVVCDRIYTSTGEQKKTMQFNCGGKWQHIKSEGSFDIRGDRGTPLGTNM